MRGNILRSYREFLTLLQRLPKNAYLSARQEAKAKILTHRNETDSLKITNLHKELVAKISFLRMTTNRRPGERHRSSSGTFVLREGELVESASDRESRCIYSKLHNIMQGFWQLLCSSRAANGQVSMDEFKQRHNQLLRRQHFGRAPPASHNNLF